MAENPTHQGLMSHELLVHERSRMGYRLTKCPGEAKAQKSIFSSDVKWVIFECQQCGCLIYTVEGRAHWWNKEFAPETHEANETEGQPE